MAKQGYEALMNGDEHVYAADLKTKLEGKLMGLVPNALQAKMHDKMAKPLSEK